MRNLNVLLILLVIIGAPVAYAVHLGWNYHKLRKDLAERSSHVFSVKVGDNEISEVGYIYSMRKEYYLRDENLVLAWEVVIPSTNKKYACFYDEGFSDFKQGDSVQIIHAKKHKDEDIPGLIVGLYGPEKGKVTLADIGDKNHVGDELDIEPDDEPEP